MHIPFQNAKMDLKKHLPGLEIMGEQGRYLDGRRVDFLEDMIAKKCGRKFGVAVGSCSDALFFSLLVSGIGPKDEVIITSFSYPASVNSVLRTGATPRFADINPHNYMMELDPSLITDETKAIIVTHLFGQVMDFDAVERFAKLYNLVVIEDTAQSLGSSWGARPAGSLGELSCLSFDPVKPLGSITTGGMILTNNGETVTKLKTLRNQGKNPQTGEHEIMGYNSRLSEIAALVIHDKAETELVKRSSVYMRKLIAEEYFLSALEDIKDIQLPGLDFTLLSDNVWTKFVIQAERRDELKEYLEKNGIETRVHYPKPLPDLSYVEDLEEYWRDDTPDARFVSHRVLSFPLYPEMTIKEVTHIRNKIKEFYGH